MGYFRNERGGALVYVIAIFLILIVFSPALLSTLSSSDLQQRKTVIKQRVLQLVESGIQRFYDEDDPYVYLLQHTYDLGSPLLVEAPGQVPIHYYQYAVNRGEASPEEPAHAVDLTLLSDLAGKQVVVMAIAGDTNGNAQRDHGERDFVQRWLIYTPATDVAPGNVDVPKFHPLPRQGDAYFRVIVEKRADLLITIQPMNSSMEDSYLIPAALLEEEEIQGTVQWTYKETDLTRFGGSMSKGDVIKAKARIDSERWTPEGRVVVLDKSAPVQPGRGYVWYEDEEGNREYRLFDPKIPPLNEDEIDATLVMDGIKVNLKENHKGIVFRARNGIMITEDSDLTTNSNGRDAGITMHSSEGDIILNGINLASTNNSRFNTIEIYAYGDVYLENAALSATREIIVQAEGTIYASGAELHTEREVVMQSSGRMEGLGMNITAGNEVRVQAAGSIKVADSSITAGRSNKNSPIVFELMSEGDERYIFADRLNLNKDARALPAATVKICGQLNEGTINGQRYHADCPD